jgi:bacterioferritin
MAQREKASKGRARFGAGKGWAERLQQMDERAQQNLEEGALTDGYKADKEEVIDLLNRALAGEWASFLQYWHHYGMASDIHSAEVRDEWKEHAEDEYKHALMFMERIKQLGGVPANDPKQIDELNPSPFTAGHDLRSMIEADLVGERATIDFYSEAIRTCGFDDSATRVLFEEALSDECHHADELADFLFQYDASTGEQIPTVHEKVLELGHSGGQRPGESARESLRQTREARGRPRAA